MNAPATKKTSSMAITALVCGILGAFTCGLTSILGVILGVVAMIKIGKSQGSLGGQGLAIAGIAVGGLTLFFGLGMGAAIAIPNFLKFQAKAKQSEVRMELRKVHTMQKAYHSENGQYAKSFGDLGFETDTSRYYSYFLGDEVKGAAKLTRSDLPADIQPTSDEGGYLVIGAGNLDSDPTLDIWVVDQNGIPKNIGSDF